MKTDYEKDRLHKKLRTVLVLQGGLVLAKSGRLEWGFNILRTL